MSGWPPFSESSRSSARRLAALWEPTIRLLAFSDAIEDFRPDHILVGLRGAGERGWQEHGLLEDVLKRFGLPITVVVV